MNGAGGGLPGTDRQAGPQLDHPAGHERLVGALRDQRIGTPAYMASFTLFIPPCVTNSAACSSTSGCGTKRRASTLPGSGSSAAGSTAPVETITVPPSGASASANVRSSRGPALNTVPSDAYSTGARRRPIGNDGSRGRAPTLGPTNRYDGSKSPAPGWNAREVKTRLSGSRTFARSTSGTPCVRWRRCSAHRARRNPSAAPGLASAETSSSAEPRVGLGTFLPNANVVNSAAAGTRSSRAATAPHGQADPWTIRSGPMPRRSARTAGSRPVEARASASSIVIGIGGSGTGWSPPG